MEIKLEKLIDENISYFEISKSKDLLKKLKEFINDKNNINLKLSFNTLCLGTKLYGNSKEESKIIQKNNCKDILKLNSICEKVVKLLIKSKVDFNGKIFVENLEGKKNNNDFLIQSLLNLKFNKYKSKMEQIITFSSDYLSKENNLNNMCDFKDNKCVSCRERNIDRVIGCCQKNCKYTHTGICNVKNISCKLYMCDYVENRGYYFSPYYLPITKKYFSLTQRFFSTCLLFKSLEFQSKVLRYCKIFPYVLIGIIFLIILVGIV